MCDEQTESDIDAAQRTGGQINRREFSKLSMAAGVLSALPRLADAMSVTETNIEVTTSDGVADCYFVHPSSGQHPAVLVWPDILGLRPAFRMMGKRLAESGYSVLVVNPYYRVTKSPVAPEGASFRDPEIRELVLPMARQLTQETCFSDAKAFIGFLDQQASVDTARKVGTTGYCMGGPMVMRTAAAVPDRVGAVASFHGGGLFSDKADSPHLLIPETSAHVLHAVAANDHERSPEVKGKLIAAYKEAGIPAEIEVYKDTLHGWCALDSAAYNEAQAERAWARLLVLLQTALV
jgi:carboxymethylenebutenolidase